MRLLAFVAVFFCFLSGNTAQGYYLDTPHNESNGIYCHTCHSMSVWWTHTPSGIDDTVSNAICLTCHDEASTDPKKGPAKKLHASSTTSTDKGAWTTECTQCHDVHFQGQLDWAGLEDSKLYLAQGIFNTGVAVRTYTDPNPSPSVLGDDYTTIGISGVTGWTDTASWGAKGGNVSAGRAVDNSRGLILVPNKANPVETFEIISVVGNVIKVKGKMNLAPNGQTFGVIYGQAIRSYVLPNGAQALADSRDVKFFQPSVLAGTYGGYVDETAAVTEPQGLCQVCHSQTSFWTLDGSNPTHNAGSDCGQCHNVLEGGPGSTDHAAFIGDRLGNGCGNCHAGHAAAPDSAHAGGCDSCHGAARPGINGNAMANEGGVTVSAALDNGVYNFTPRLTDGEGDSIASASFLKIDCSECHEAKPAALLAGTHGGHAADAFAWDGNCADCHGPATLEVVKDVHADTCTFCHEVAAVAAGDYSLRRQGDALNGIDGDARTATLASTCTGCHSLNTPGVIHHVSKSGYAAAGTCTACHATSGHQGNHAARVADYANCTNCHAATVGSATGAPVNPANGRIHDACVSCHNVDSTLKTLAQVGGTRVTAMPNGGAGSNNGGGTCFACHGEYFSKHANADHSARVAGAVACTACHTATAGTTTAVPVNSANNKVHDACATCHSTNGSLKAAYGKAVAMPAGGGSCTLCHGAYFPNHAVSHLTRVAGTVNCDSCHAGTAGLVTGMPLSAANGKVHDACNTCHNDAGDNRLKAPYGKAVAMPAGGGNCNACHGAYFASHVNASHASRVGGTANCTGCHTATAGTATTVPVSAADNKVHDACATCHNTTTGVLLAAYGKASAMPAGGGDCNGCHGAYFVSHVNADHTTRVAGLAACTGCHNATAGTATTVPTDATPGNKVHDACVSCHNATTGALLAVTAPGGSANIGAGNCGTCHGAAYFYSHNHHATAANQVSYDGGVNDKTTGGMGCGNCHKDSGGSLSTWNDIATEHATVNSLPVNPCSICHEYATNGNQSGGADTPPLAAVQGAITSGSPATCATCHIHKVTTPHGAIDHVAELVVTADTCAVTCHGGGSADVVFDTHKGNCSNCHIGGDGYAGLKNLASGHGRLDPGFANPNTCRTCHSLVDRDTHHASAKAKAGRCEICHLVDTTKANRTGQMPKQLPCSQCHVQFSGGQLVINGLAFTPGYNDQVILAGNPLVATPMYSHSMASDAGVIYNYSACFACHATGMGPDNLPNGAPIVQPFHGRPDPALFPADLGAGSTPKEEHVFARLENAPGRGTFNLMGVAGANGLIDKDGTALANFRHPWHYYNSSAVWKPEYEPFDGSFDTPAIPYTMTVIPWDNYNTTGVTANFKLPIFAELALPVYDDLNVTSAEWNGSQVVVTAINTQGGATLTATYNGTPVAMTEAAANSYTVTINDPVFVNKVLVTSSIGNGIEATVVDTTAGTDVVTVSSAVWNGAALGSQLSLAATNTVAGAALQAKYNGVFYPLTETAANSYAVTIADAVYAAGVTVTSDYGGHATPAVVNATISVTKAEWNHLNVGSELVVWATSATPGSLTATFNGNSQPMAWNAGSSRYEATISGATYVGTVRVVSSIGGDTTAGVTDVTPDVITITAANWNGDNVGNELYVTASNTTVGAALDVHYNAGTYFMSVVSTNNYSALINNATYLATIQVTSNRGGDTSGAVTNVTPDHITITKAEWNGDNSGSELVVWATNDRPGATLTLNYRGFTYPMTWNGGSSRYEATIGDANFVSSLTVDSSVYSGSKTGVVTNVTPGSDFITVNKAEWCGDTGTTLTVWATNSTPGAGLTVIYNGASYPMVDKGQNLYALSQNVATAPAAAVPPNQVTVSSDIGGSVNATVTDTSTGGGGGGVTIWDHSYYVSFAPATSETCINCHNSGSPDVVYQIHGAKCDLCHTASPPTLKAGAMQRWNTATGTLTTAADIPGAAWSNRTCATCHQAFTASTGRYKSWEHHYSDNAQAGNCVHCHADVRKNTNVSAWTTGIAATTLPKQAPCAYCHVDYTRQDSDGSWELKTFDFVAAGFNNPISSVISSTHTIPNAAGGSASPVKIHDFSACFTCHDRTDMFSGFAFGAPATAPPMVRPFHAAGITQAANLGGSLTSRSGNYTLVAGSSANPGTTKPQVPLNFANLYNEANYEKKGVAADCSGGTTNAIKLYDNQTATQTCKDDFHFAYYNHPGRGGITDTNGVIMSAGKPVGAFNLLFKWMSPTWNYINDASISTPKYYVSSSNSESGGSNTAKSAYKGAGLDGVNGANNYAACNSSYTDSGGRVWNFCGKMNVPFNDFNRTTYPNGYWVTVPSFADIATPAVPDRVRLTSVDCAATPNVSATSNLTTDYFLGSTAAGSVKVSVNGGAAQNMTWNGTTQAWEYNIPSCSTQAGNPVTVTSYLGGGGSAGATVPGGGGGCTPPGDPTVGDAITITTAEWNGNNVGSELLVSASNTVGGATLYVNYNNYNYLMTNVGGNNYQATISNGTYAAALTVASSAGAESSHAVADVTPVDDVVTVTKAEWNTPSGGTLTVWATHAYNNGSLTYKVDFGASTGNIMTWNGANNRYEAVLTGVTYNASCSVYSNSPGGDTVNGLNRPVTNLSLDTVTVTKAEYNGAVGGGTLTVWATHSDNNGVKTYKVDYGASTGNVMTWNSGSSRYELALAGQAAYVATCDVYSSDAGGDSTNGLARPVTNITPDNVVISKAVWDGTDLTVWAVSSFGSLGPVSLTYTADASCNGALTWNGANSRWENICTSALYAGGATVTVTSGAYGGGSANLAVTDQSGAGGGNVPHDTYISFAPATSETCINCHNSGSPDVVYDIHGSRCDLCHTASPPALKTGALQRWINATGALTTAADIPGAAYSNRTCAACHQAFTASTGRYKSWEHHYSDNAQAGNCVHCHSDVRKNTNVSAWTTGLAVTTLPKQAPCAYCHVDYTRQDSDGTWELKTFDFAAAGFNNPISSVISSTHTIPNAAGGSASPVKIHDFSVCFTCHDRTDMFSGFAFGAPSTAPPMVRPFHAAGVTQATNLGGSLTSRSGSYTLVAGSSANPGTTKPQVPLNFANLYNENNYEKTGVAANCTGGTLTGAKVYDDQTATQTCKDDFHFAYYYHPGRGGITDTSGVIMNAGKPIGSFNLLYKWMSPYWNYINDAAISSPKFYGSGNSESGSSPKNAYKLAGLDTVNGSSNYAACNSSYTDSGGRVWNFCGKMNVPYNDFNRTTYPNGYWVTVPTFADLATPIVADKVRITKATCSATPKVTAWTNLTTDHYLGSTAAGSVKVSINGGAAQNMTWNGTTSRWESNATCSAGQSVLVTSYLSGGGSASTTAQ